MKLLYLLQFYFGYKEKSWTDDMMEGLAESLTYFIPFFISGMVIFIIGIIIYAVASRIKLSKAEKICVKVKVLDKISKLSRTDPYNYIVFEKENGERLKFLILDDNKYTTIVIGDEGYLTYANSAFIDFIRISK